MAGSGERSYRSSGGKTVLLVEMCWTVHLTIYEARRNCDEFL
jgi:hypothetical protein